jgi:plastocyanin
LNAGAVSVTIAGFAYSPEPLQVKPGETVSVSNNDDASHTVTSATGGQFESGNVAHDQKVTFTAPTQPGTYNYICKYHPRMHGTLVVQP